MNKEKKRKVWLIAFILTVIVFGGTAAGVLYLESLLEKNQLPASYEKLDTLPSDEEKADSIAEEDLNPSSEGSEKKENAPTETYSAGANQPAMQSDDEQKSPAEHKQENPIDEQNDGSQNEEQLQPEVTDSPLDENELPPI